MPTPMPKENEIERKWFVLDAEGQVLGRLASRVASILRGKHKSNFARHLDVGDHVVDVNAGKVQLTGRKLRDKVYRWHSGYMGGLREVRAETMLKIHPERVIEWAVQGMLPVLRQHPLHRPLDDALGMNLQHGFRSHFTQAPHVPRVPAIDLVAELPPRQLDLPGVHVDDMVAHVEVPREVRLVLSAED